MSGSNTTIIKNTVREIMQTNKIRNWFRLQKEDGVILLQTSPFKDEWITIRTFTDIRKANEVFRKIWWVNAYPNGPKLHTYEIDKINWRLINHEEALEYMTSLAIPREIYSLDLKRSKVARITDTKRLYRSKILGYAISEENRRTLAT